MNGTMPDDALLGAFAATAPDVNALDVTTFNRLSGRNDFSIVGVRGRKI